MVDDPSWNGVPSAPSRPSEVAGNGEFNEEDVDVDEFAVLGTLEGMRYGAVSNERVCSCASVGCMSPFAEGMVSCICCA